MAGQLGNDSTTDSNVPVDVAGLSSGIVAVSAGESHTCALTASGGVKCWGDNFDGQLGNGTTVDSHVPHDVMGLSSGVGLVTSGSGVTCAVTSQGALQCWGLDYSGQLGDGSTTNRNVPGDVVGLSGGVLGASAGRAGVVCAVAAGGAVKCWGFNHYGELGNDATEDSHVPVDVVGLSSGAAAISVDGSACALTLGGSLLCWGPNSNGDLGDGTTLESHVPVHVMGLSSGVLAVAAGGNHTCAIVQGGALQCWGRNDLGQLGDGTTMESDVPVDVMGALVGRGGRVGGRLSHVRDHPRRRAKVLGLQRQGAARHRLHRGRQRGSRRRRRALTFGLCIGPTELPPTRASSSSSAW